MGGFGLEGTEFADDFTEPEDTAMDTTQREDASHFSEYAKFLQYQLPLLLRRELESSMEVPLGEDVIGQIVGLVRDSHDTLCTAYQGSLTLDEGGERVSKIAASCDLVASTGRPGNSSSNALPSVTESTTLLDSDIPRSEYDWTVNDFFNFPSECEDLPNFPAMEENDWNI